MDRNNGRKRKTLQQLTFKDAFMFAAVMLDEKIAKGVLERILDVEIDRVEVDAEKSIVYHPEFKGVRLDVYIKDARGTHYNVEMQVENRQIRKRSRYYHSQIDMELLETGLDYETLPDAYVIFICDYDPIGLKKYRYTRRQTLKEDDTYEYEDGSHTIFLSTKGTNVDEVPEALVKFLDYVGAELENSEKDYGDELVLQLQNRVNAVKENREMGSRYMLLEEMLKDERAEGHAEGRADGRIEGEQLHLIKIIRKKKLQGWSIQQMADEYDESETLIKQICDAIEASAPDASPEDIYDYMQA